MLYCLSVRIVQLCPDDSDILALANFEHAFEPSADISLYIVVAKQKVGIDGIQSRHGPVVDHGEIENPFVPQDPGLLVESSKIVLCIRIIRVVIDNDDIKADSRNG